MVGSVLAERYKSSVLNNPTPLALVSLAALASSRLPMFARTGTNGSELTATNSIDLVASDSSSLTRTRSPTGSTKTRSPFSSEAASGQETTAAIDFERQMIAVCEVGPPLSVMTPTTASVNCAVSAGEKSSPTRTILPFSGIDNAISIPARRAWTLFERSWKSATRSSNVGSPPRSSENSSTAFPIAAAAIQPSSM